MDGGGEREEGGMHSRKEGERRGSLSHTKHHNGRERGAFTRGTISKEGKDILKNFWLGWNRLPLPLVSQSQFMQN